MKCKVRGCQARQWQRPSGLPCVLCEKHATQVAKAIPSLLEDQAFIKSLQKPKLPSGGLAE